MQLNNFDVAIFLRDYWQRKPLLLRNPWGNWRNPLMPDELAGLACEKDVESRLIIRTGDTWGLEHGPIAETRFAELGDRLWTLLVQAVDHHVPDVAALVEPFRFIPNWRVDDVMVSYAADEGGVGPHFDQYDVFLVQGLGKRRWQIGQTCERDTELLPHDDLRLLAHFEATEEWVLEPGDILYLPPGVPHDGIAVGSDCMTYSIGFRAPSSSELIASWCDDLLANLADDDRYADPGLLMQGNPGEISAQAIAKLHEMAIAKMLDRDSFARWFGRYSSTRRYPDMDWQPDVAISIDELRKAIADGLVLYRNLASRFSFVARDRGAILLFIDGESFECTSEVAHFAKRLCAQTRIEVDPALMHSEAALALIAALHDQGSVAFDSED